MGQWDLSYESITSNIALREWFKKPAEFWLEIEESEPFITLPNMYLEEDDEKMFNGEDDEDVSIELSTLIMTGVDKGSLPTSYKFLGNGIVYDKAWDETAELFVIDEVKGALKEKIGSNADKIKSSEAGDGQLGKSDVEKSEREESEVEKGQVEESEVGENEVAKSEPEENDTEESDHFEDCNKMLENSLNFLVKCDHF